MAFILRMMEYRHRKGIAVQSTLKAGNCKILHREYAINKRNKGAEVSAIDTESLEQFLVEQSGLHCKKLHSFSNRYSGEDQPGSYYKRIQEQESTVTKNENKEVLFIM